MTAANNRVKDDALRHDDGRKVETPANRGAGDTSRPITEASAGSRGKASGKNLDQQKAASGTPQGGVKNAGDTA